tara:strand:- start:221 stop:406 length:186 start_codon:yes stop_codon:yes gene_type:complete
MMARERIFSGKKYESGAYALTYGKAQTQARSLRKKGYSVRVIPAPKDINQSGKWFSVFTRR